MTGQVNLSIEFGLPHWVTGALLLTRERMSTSIRVSDVSQVATLLVLYAELLIAYV